jgi:hypothetical protein
MIDGQTGATSGHRLISNKSMAEGDRVQVRPSENGLQRIDAKNQERVAPQTEVPDVLEFYFQVVDYQVLICNDLTTYEIPLIAKGGTDIAIKATGTDASGFIADDSSGITPSGVSFEFKPDGGSYSSISISGSQTSLSGSGTLKITYTDPDQITDKGFRLIFYNGRKSQNIRAITFITIYDSRAVSSLDVQKVCIINQFINNPAAIRSTANSIILKYSLTGVHSASPFFQINVNGEVTTIPINAGQSKKIPFSGYPIALPIDLSGLSSYPPLVDTQKIIASRDPASRNKGKGIKGLVSIAYKMLAQPNKMRYRFNIPSETATDLGDIYYTDSAPSSPVEGDRYTFLNTGTTDSSWGSPTPVEKGDRVRFDGTAWEFEQIGYYFYQGLDTDAISIRDGTRATLVGVISYVQSGLGLVVTYLDASTYTAIDLSFSLLNIGKWQEFQYRYSLLDSELLTVEATCNEQVLSQDVAPSSSIIFNFTGLIDSSVFTFTVRFKSQSGSTWFQV